MKSFILEALTLNKKSVTHLVFMFQLIFFFLAFWGAVKHVFHIVPFLPTRYVLKSFRCLDVSKHLRNRKNNKKQHLREVENSNMLIGNTNIHKHNNVSEFINKLSFICVLWIYSYSELKWRQNSHFSMTRTANSQIETLVSYSRATNVNVNKSLSKSNFEGDFSTYVFCKSFWHHRALKIECWVSRHILWEKNNKYFRMFGV